MAHAVIDPNGNILWKQDPKLVTSMKNPAGPGRYLLRFASPCNQDVFVLDAKPEGPGCDAPSIVATSIQSGPFTICVSTDFHGGPGQGVDCQFSYVRYSRGDDPGLNLADTGSELAGQEVSCEGVATRDFYAWLNLMPIGPPTINVVGEVQVPNPGVDVFLTYKVPQGINPNILLLDLHLIQRPGNGTDTWKTVHYQRPAGGVEYSNVEIFCGSQSLIQVPVEKVE